MSPSALRRAREQPGADQPRDLLGGQLDVWMVENRGDCDDHVGIPRLGRLYTGVHLDGTAQLIRQWPGRRAQVQDRDAAHADALDGFG
jgi:hypothetical protein